MLPACQVGKVSDTCFSLPSAFSSPEFIQEIADEIEDSGGFLLLCVRKSEETLIICEGVHYEVFETIVLNLSDSFSNA